MPPRKSDSGTTARARSSASAFGRATKATSTAANASAAAKKAGVATSGQAKISRSASAESGLAQAFGQSASTKKNAGAAQSYSKEQLEKVKDLPELDVHDPSWDPYWEVVQKKMGLPKVQPSE